MVFYLEMNQVAGGATYKRRDVNPDLLAARRWLVISCRAAAGDGLISIMYNICMKRDLIFHVMVLFALALGLAGCLPTANGPEPEPVLHTYAQHDEPIRNPERGFRFPAEIAASTNFSTFYRALGVTLVHAYVQLDDYRDRDLPQAFLDALDAGFEKVYGSGVKVVLRFAYNQGPYPQSEPDASEEQVLRHIRQLEPLLEKHAGVIAWMEAGFIGAWGEWHTSTHGLDQSLDTKRKILTALLEALPPERMVMLRYPTDIIRLFPEPLGESQAFSGSDQARTGHHNDCFLASEDDWGTYSREGQNTIDTDQAYLAEISRFTPTGGETCSPNPPRSSCATALREMALLHFSEINQAFHSRVVKDWQTEGCFDEIKDRLGYRLALQQAEFNPTARPGGILNLAVDLQNSGFAAPINPRPLMVVLDGPQRYEVELPVDPRRWEPGTVSFSVRLRLPSNAPEGTYRLALWLPDPDPALHASPLYAIQFANEGVWDEEQGYNVLSESFEVDPAAGGSAAAGQTGLTVMDE